MKIAVVGSGIAGLTAAYQLSDIADIAVFEADSRLGGHTHTVDVGRPDGTHSVDTGFIVFNDWTYPNFCKLMDSLGVESQESDMSFGLRNDSQRVEFALPSLDAFFAHRSRLLSPTYYALLADVVRFCRTGKQVAAGVAGTITLGEYFEREKFSRAFLNWYIIPMIAAIWSASPDRIPQLPAAHFLQFFRNHGLLNLFARPRWRVIKGGSRNYIEPLIQTYKDGIRLNSPVLSIRRHEDHVELHTSEFGWERFDHVVIAAHSDQTLRMLSDATSLERDVLGAITYKPNDVVLHTDTTLLPRNRRAWASWNYHVYQDDATDAKLTYHMNRLQSLDAQEEFCVSLNQTGHIDPDRIHGQFTYAHPAFDGDAVRAQRRHHEISGHNRTHYCGAYWGYGFHEDGVNSALAATAFFGKGELA